MQVPARVDAGTCARIVLLHLVHVLPSSFMDLGTAGRVDSFLDSAARPLEPSSVLCERCRDVADLFRVPAADSLLYGTHSVDDDT